MRARVLARTACLLSGFALGVGLQGAGAQCTLARGIYTCDRGQFRQTLAHAATAQVDPAAAAKDRMVAAKLRELVSSLGKSAPAQGQAADLTFSLIRVDSAGVVVGPSGTELAVLRVYGPASDGGAEPSAAGTLLWAESYTGQPDLSWPATVQATINQFRVELKR